MLPKGFSPLVLLLYCTWCLRCLACSLFLGFSHCLSSTHYGEHTDPSLGLLPPISPTF